MMNLEELAEQIHNDFQLGEDKEFIEAITNNTAESFAYGAHFGLGIRIRNQYGLWNEKSKWMQSLPDNIKTLHPDDVSHKILMEIHRCGKKKINK
jgi:hypothetical protein